MDGGTVFGISQPASVLKPCHRCSEPQRSCWSNQGIFLSFSHKRAWLPVFETYSPTLHPSVGASCSKMMALLVFAVGEPLYLELAVTTVWPRSFESQIRLPIQLHQASQASVCTWLSHIWGYFIGFTPIRLRKEQEQTIQP